MESGEIALVALIAFLLVLLLIMLFCICRYGLIYHELELKPLMDGDAHIIQQHDQIANLIQLKMKILMMMTILMKNVI